MSERVCVFERERERERVRLRNRVSERDRRECRLGLQNTADCNG